MTTISPTRKLDTLINVFTVEPANQERLLDLLARATETSVRHAPGFISASLHRGLDGIKVTMYAQWRSVEDYEAMRRNPGPIFSRRAQSQSSIRECTKSSRLSPGLQPNREEITSRVASASRISASHFSACCRKKEETQAIASNLAKVPDLARKPAVGS